MRRTAVLIAAALLLAGCGATATSRVAPPHFSTLCVDAGLPLTGADGAIGSDLVAGLRMVIPTTGVPVAGYHVRICHVRNDAASVPHQDGDRQGNSGGGGTQRGDAVMADARAADGDLHTVAYVGGLSAGDARTADAVLAEAGIALVTPSGPTVTPAGEDAVGSVPVRSTALYLLPSASTEADAVQEVRAAKGCGKLRHGRPVCTVLGPSTAPLCSGLAPAQTTRRFCVMAGPDLSSWASPALAYGESAGELIIAALKAIASGGGDVANRSTVLTTLRHARLASTPIGPIRFDSAGAMEADRFNVYTVGSDGGLVMPHPFSTH